MSYPSLYIANFLFPLKSFKKLTQSSINTHFERIFLMNNWLCRIITIRFTAITKRKVNYSPQLHCTVFQNDFCMYSGAIAVVGRPEFSTSSVCIRPQSTSLPFYPKEQSFNKPFSQAIALVERFLYCFENYKNSLAKITVPCKVMIRMP